LYDFVSTRIRYVGIDFGVGRYQPHAADEVLADQYGDCKDKDTLLEALLRAKGFHTAPALIGMDIGPAPEMPSPALFNHVVTTVDLPGGKIWLDTTPEVAPYRVLTPQIRDELALVVPATGAPRLERTPAEPPFAYFERFEAVDILDKDGLLKSHMDMTLRSDNELGFRILVERAAPAQWDEAMQSVSRAMGFPGTVSDTDLKQKDTAGPVHLSYDYTRPSFADWENHRILTYMDKDKAPEHDIDQGAPRTLEATTRISLPDGYRAALPAAIHVKRDYASFDQTYQFDKGQLIVERKAVILKKKVSKAEWKDYYAYTRELGVESGENYISLLEPFRSLPEVSSATVAVTESKDAKAGAASPANAPATVTYKDEDAARRDTLAYMQASLEMLAEMVKGANALEREGKWAAARMMLEEVKSKEPDYSNIMSMLGAVAQHEGRLEEATRDYEAEISKHGEASSRLLVQLASLYVSASRYQDAVVLLRKYLDRNDVILFTALADAEARSGDRAAALATLQRALKAHPHDNSL
jgi:tetratricopeptide (TPR) repeat protein